jgi:protein dithiol oxidoreductase (disulfide-forming)
LLLARVEVVASLSYLILFEEKNMLSKLKLFAAVALSGLVAAVSAVPAAAQFVVGRDYSVLKTPQSMPDDGKIEILEFFAYGCPHCGALEPVMAEWIKKQGPDIVVRRVPTIPGFSLRGIENGPLYYTLEAMGQLNKLHEKIFDAANRDGVILASAADQNKWLAKQGVDIKVFEATRNSFSVDSKIKSATKLAETYKITSTPTMIVAGKYAASQTQGPAHLLAVVDSLVAQVRATMKKPVSSVTAAPAVASAATAATKPAVKPTVVKPSVVATPVAAGAK